MAEPSPYPDEWLDGVVRYALATSASKAAEKYRISLTLVIRQMRKRGVPVRRKGSPDVYPPLLRKRAARMYLSGEYTGPKVEAMTGIPAKYVYDLANKFRQRGRA